MRPSLVTGESAKTSEAMRQVQESSVESGSEETGQEESVVKEHKKEMDAQREVGVSAEKKIEKSPASVAWEKWRTSEVGIRCRETMHVQGKYLENRLWHAFMDGFRSAECILKGGE